MIKNFKNVEEIPFSLNGDDVALALNISRAGAYNLMKSEGFPSIKIGKRIIVPKEGFIQWMNENVSKQVQDIEKEV